MIYHRNPYPLEYRQNIIQLYQAGRSLDDLASGFEPHRDTIKGWIKQAERTNPAEHIFLGEDEHQELKRLRKEVKILRQERDLLSKAASWFANRETNARSSHS